MSSGESSVPIEELVDRAEATGRAGEWAEAVEA
jgi:hypothetical protein